MNVLKWKGREIRKLSGVSVAQESALREARERTEHPRPCSRGIAIRIDTELPPAKKAVFIQKVVAAVGQATNSIDQASGKFKDQFVLAIKDGPREPGIVQHGFSPEDEIAKQKLVLADRYLQSPQLTSDRYRGLTMLFFCFHEDLVDMELALLQTKIKIIALQEGIKIDPLEELNFEGMEPGERVELEESPAARMAREEREAARALEEAKQSITTLEAASDGLFINIDPATPLAVAERFVHTVMAEAGRITESIAADGRQTERWLAMATKSFTSCTISCFNQGLADKEARLLQVRIKMIAARLGVNITKMELKKGPEGEGTGIMIVGQIQLGGKPIIVKIRLGFPAGSQGVPEGLINFAANPRVLLATVRDMTLVSIAAGDLEGGSQIHFPSLKFDPTVNTDGVELLSMDPVNDRLKEQISVTFQPIDNPEAKA